MHQPNLLTRVLSAAEPAALVQLRTMRLQGSEELWRVSRALALCTGLISLDLSRTGVERLRHVSCLVSLTRLSVRQCDSLWDLGSLAPLTKLAYVDVSYCTHAWLSLHPLAQTAASLARLEATHCQAVMDCPRSFPAIGHCTSLARLLLNANGTHPELTPLGSLHRLHHLDLNPA